MAHRGECDLRQYADFVVPRIDRVSLTVRIAPPRHFQTAGSLRDLFIDRGHLHTVPAGRNADRHRVVAVRDHLGARHSGHYQETLV